MSNARVEIGAQNAEQQQILENTEIEDFFDAIRQSNIEKIKQNQHISLEMVHPALQWRPIDCAAFCGNIEMIKYLIDSGVNPTVANPVNNKTAMFYAAERGQIATMIFLNQSEDVPSEKRIRFDENPFALMSFALRANQKEVMIFLNRGKEVRLDERIPFNIKAKNGTTLMHYAAMIDNSIPMMIFLNQSEDVPLNQQIPFNVIDEDGNTAMHYATSNNKKEVMLFLNKGVEVPYVQRTSFNVQNHKGVTLKNLAHLQKERDLMAFIDDQIKIETSLINTAVVTKALERTSIKNTKDIAYLCEEFEKLKQEVNILRELRMEDAKQIIYLQNQNKTLNNALYNVHLLLSNPNYQTARMVRTAPKATNKRKANEISLDPDDLHLSLTLEEEIAKKQKQIFTSTQSTDESSEKNKQPPLLPQSSVSKKPYFFELTGEQKSFDANCKPGTNKCSAFKKITKKV